MEGQRDLVGFFPDKSHDHHMYISRKGSGSLPFQTLEEIILSSPLFPWVAPVGGGLVLNKKDRLYLANELAHSVLKFQGSWLCANWSIHDIMLPKEFGKSFYPIDRPFLMWNVLIHPEATTSHTPSSVIRHETLFPLGLALIELSLGRTITALRIPEDENPDEKVALLKTANRCIDFVYGDSGAIYGDVVQKCLFWSHTRETDLDSEESQDTVFRHIISPLLVVVKNFDKPARFRF